MPPDPAGSVRSWWQKQQPWPCHELGAGLSTKSRRHFKRAARGMSSRTVLITMAPTFTMLDSEFSEAATQPASALDASATGNAERQVLRLFFEPWSVARAPVAL